VLDAAYERHPERFVRRRPAPPERPTAAWIDKPDTRRPLTKFDHEASHRT
jgi:putative transposase